MFGIRVLYLIDSRIDYRIMLNSCTKAEYVLLRDHTIWCIWLLDPKRHCLLFGAHVLVIGLLITIKVAKYMKRVVLLNGGNGADDVSRSHEPYFIPLGKRSQCNSLVLDQMIYYVERLIPQKDACHLIGLFESTHWRWMKQGKDYIAAYEEDWDTKPAKSHRMYGDYYTAINKAIAECRRKIIERSLEPDKLIPTWVRDMTILERRDRDNWSRQREPLLNTEQEYDPDESFL